MEMSTKTANPNFILRKKIEKHFADKYPEKWIPLYSRVTFSDKPYADALAIGDEQRDIMDEVMNIEGIEDKWESEEVDKLILKLLQPNLDKV